MARKPLSYRIVLRNKKGKFSKLRYAESYEIFYGKRKVLGKKIFSKNEKKVADKKALIESVVKAIEKVRLQRLKKQRDQRRKKKIVRTNEKAKRELKKRLKKPESKFQQRMTDEIRDEVQEAGIQLPVFPKVEALPPATATRANVIDTLMIPIAPDGGNYQKQIIDKEMYKDEVGSYHLAILNFSLDPDAYLEMTAENFKDTYKLAFMKFAPHVAQYFEDVKNSSKHFIFRLKFLNNWQPDQAYEHYGISQRRIEIRDRKSMFHLMRETFLQLFGDTERFGYTVHNKRRANYLEGEKIIYITGFTLEATDLS